MGEASRLRLRLPPDMPTLAGLEVPRDFYWVLAPPEAPAPLAGMAYPAWPPCWHEMYTAGFRHVICLVSDTFAYMPAPLNPLHATRLADLFGGVRPVDPAAEKRKIQVAAALALARLAQGEGVIVHCAGGTGRTGTVLGCILRRLGFPASEVVRYLACLHRARGHDGWPESSWQAAVVEEL
jgi:hypothetical protein